MYTTHLCQLCMFQWPPDDSTIGGPQVNKFIQVSSDGLPDVTNKRRGPCPVRPHVCNCSEAREQQYSEVPSIS